MYNLFLNIWPTTVEGWVYLAILICSLIGTIAGLIKTLFKLKKTGVQLKDALKQLVKHKDFDKIMAIANAAMQEAEATKLKGKDKKDMVFAAVRAGCKEAGIEIDDEILNELSDHIDEMIDFFNKMQNANKHLK